MKSNLSFKLSKKGAEIESLMGGGEGADPVARSKAELVKTIQVNTIVFKKNRKKKIRNEKLFSICVLYSIFSKKSVFIALGST